jgi:hypothetical protein
LNESKCLILMKKQTIAIVRDSFPVIEMDSAGYKIPTVCNSFTAMGSCGRLNG